MPKRKYDVPIFKRGDYWHCHVRTPDGKRIARPLHLRDDGSQASLKLAKAAYWQEQARATAGQVDSKTQAKTLAKGLEALMREQALAELSEPSRLRTVFSARCLLEYFGSDRDLHSIGSAEMVAFASAMKTKYAGTTLAALMSCLTRAMQAVDVPIPRRPKLGSTSPKPQEPLTTTELRQVILAAKKPEHKIVIQVFAQLGIRRGEYQKLAEIDWQRQLIHVAGTKTRRSDRWVPIADELFEMMLEMKAANGGVWPGWPAYSYHTVYHIITTACVRAGIGRRHPNDLRGTFATMLSIEEVGGATRGALQGNSPAMQDKTYAQPEKMPEELHRAVRKLPRIRPKKKPQTQTPNESNGT